MSKTLEVEFLLQLNTQTRREFEVLSEVPAVVSLRKIFASVLLKKVTVAAFQNTLVATFPDQPGLKADGHAFFGLIPTAKNTEAASGTNGAVVYSVPRKVVCPLSSTVQGTVVQTLSLEGYELDLAQDPRRKQGPVAWVAHTGVTTNVKGAASTAIITTTWTITVECSGEAVLW